MATRSLPRACCNVLGRRRASTSAAALRKVEWAERKAAPPTLKTPAMGLRLTNLGQHGFGANGI
jgi:hypothetical protein